MASVKINIPSKVYANGTTPIFLEFIVDRVKYKKQIYAVEPEYIDHAKKEVKAKHPHAVRINRLIHKKLSEAKAYILDCQFNDEPVSPGVFFAGGKSEKDLISFLADREALLRGQGSIGRANTMKYVSGKVSASKLPTKLNLIDPDWIDKFSTFLIKLDLGPGTRGLYLATLNSIFGKAIALGLMKVNPMVDFKIPSGTGTKEWYTLEEFNKIKALTLTGKLHYVRQMFVFATMARGMRAGDALALRWVNISGGRLKYTAIKSKKEFDIMVTPAMAECLEGLPVNGEYVFPFVKLPFSLYKTDKERYRKHVLSKNNNVNQNYLSKIEALSGIHKHLTMHVARHTFSAIWLEGSSDLRVLQAFLGHSDIKTTMNYVAEIKQGAELDDAVDGLF